MLGLTGGARGVRQSREGPGWGRWGPCGQLVGGPGWALKAAGRVSTAGQGAELRKGAELREGSWLGGRS